MKCRSGCGMCCIAPSISQPLPNMPRGKVAGQACANLDLESYQCRIWGKAEYPSFCRGFQPDIDFCGSNREEAEQILTLLESSTHPSNELGNK